MALVVLAFIHFREAPPPERPLMRFADDLGAEISVASQLGPAVAISADGLRIAYVTRDLDGKNRLAQRLVGSSKSVVYAGTEGAAAPFFKPDGKWIAFFADQRLKKISVEGGPVVTLSDAQSSRGGTWSQENFIYFTKINRAALSRVSDGGGTAQPITELKNEATHRFPQLLPGGDTLLFTAARDNNSWDDAKIEVQSLKTGVRKTLLEGGYFGRYLAAPKGSGHLLYIREGTVFAAPMDLTRLELTGSGSPVLEDVSGHSGNGFAQLDVSQSGGLVYVSSPGTFGLSSLFWLNGSGNPQPLPAAPANYRFPRASPDGTRIAVGNGNLFIYEWALNRMTPLTFLKGSVQPFPTWAPDSKHLLFSIDSQDLSGPGIYWIRADGAGEPQRLVEGSNLSPSSFLRDGTRFAYFRRTPDYVIWTVALDLSDSEHPKPGKPEVFLASKASLRLPAFSPDGKWISYVTFESGAGAEVYVRPYPGPGGQWKISTGLAGPAFWSRKMPQLFYQGGSDQQIWVASYTVKGDSFLADQPQAWAKAQQADMADLMPDGKRFIAVLPAEADKSDRNTHLTFLLNFADELNRRASDRK